MAKSRLAAANFSSIGKAGQARLSKSTFAVAGLGGVGGIAFELLLRSGAGEIRIADFDFLEHSNANRQLLWSYENDGLKKEEAAIRLAKRVAPLCKVRAFGKITDENSKKFAWGCVAVIDATDTPRSRLSVFRGCKKAGVPYIFSSALLTGGMLTVFSGRDFEREFRLSKKSARDSLTCSHALGPVSNAIGCLAAQQALNLALSKPAISFPRVLSLDAFSKNPMLVHRF